MVQRQQAGSPVSFSASLISLLVCLGGRFFFRFSALFLVLILDPILGIIFAPIFGGCYKRKELTASENGSKNCTPNWAQNSTKKIWSKSLKQTNADIKDAEIDLACCRSTIASLWRSRRALDQISKTIDWKKNEWNILQMKEFSQATKVNLTHGHNVAQQGLSHERCRLTLQVLARKNLKDAPVLRDFLFWFWDPSSPVRMYFVWYSCWNLAP